jgi:alpha-D-xyloside xylohydrolase
VGGIGQPGILFARSGYVGSAAFPGCWAGDNEPNFGDNGLPGVIVAGLSAAMSGYAIWGHDTGGYQDTNFSVTPPNLFMRWAQFGCFSPIMQMHRYCSPRVEQGLHW